MQFLKIQFLLLSGAYTALANSGYLDTCDHQNLWNAPASEGTGNELGATCPFINAFGDITWCHNDLDLNLCLGNDNGQLVGQLK